MRDAGAPLLDRGVANVRPVADHDLRYRVGQAATEVGRDVAIDEGDLGTAVGDQHGMREHRRAVRI